MFRLNKLYIENFKNIKKQTFDFSNHNGLTLLIGNNSSGKSNLIEAICGVFYSLYERYEWQKSRCKAIPNKFEIEYTSTTFNNKVNVDATSYQAYNNFLSNDNKISTPDLPSRIVAIYSGEEDRLKQHYFDPFLNRYKKLEKDGVPSMFLLNKGHWDIALLCLLYSDKRQETDFTTSLLTGIEIKAVSFKFKPKDGSGTPSAHLINQLKSAGTSPIFLVDELLGNINEDEDAISLFQKLYIAKTPKHHLLDSIEFELEINSSDEPQAPKLSKRETSISKLSLQSLSEGQKKLILITAAMEFAGQDNTLFLLDEPDAHVHVSNKHKIIDTVQKYTHNRHVIITTHSPTLCKHVPSESIMMLDNGAPSNVGSEYEAAKNLVGESQAIDLLFSAKHILIVEGKTDCQYIGKAIELHKDEYPELFNSIDFIPIGGTDGDIAKMFIEKILDNGSRKTILLVDRDGAGLKCAKKVLCDESLSKNNVDINSIPNTTSKFFVMIPHKTPGCNSDFVIEDYFGVEKIKDIAIQKIQDDTKSFLTFPKVKDLMKKELLPNFCNTLTTKTDIDDFRVLLDKLRDVIKM